jgi:hypothetical protein
MAGRTISPDSSVSDDVPILVMTRPRVFTPPPRGAGWS